MMKDTITFRYRMSDRDVFYGGGVFFMVNSL